MKNSHTVQVVSKAKSVQNQIVIQARTYENERNQTVLYVSVKLDNVPVMNARVTANFWHFSHVGGLMPVRAVELFDNGSGDPDIHKDDGVYSKYLILDKNGLYKLDIHVSSDTENEAYIKNDKVKYKKKDLGTFRRYLKNLQIIVSNVITPSLNIPPSRILNLLPVGIHASQLSIAWTAPGEDLDEGTATLYNLYQTSDSDTFYDISYTSVFLYSFPALQQSGRQETHVVNVTIFNQDLYLAVRAVDKDGNMGGMSNIIKVFVPKPVESLAFALNSSKPVREGLTNYQQQVILPSMMMMKYVIAGIAVMGSLVLMVAMVVLVYMKQKASLHSDTCSEDIDSEHYENDTIYEGFSIDDFDTRKIEQLDYYNKHIV